jgi:hypothetical protein
MTARNGSYSPLCSAAYDGQIRLVPRFRFPPAMCAPTDILQGGVTPIVRRGTLDLGDGKFAIAAGDIHCTVDPLLAQGANGASHAAFVLAEDRKGCCLRRAILRAR